MPDAFAAMPALVRFLLARIDDEEAALRAAHRTCSTVRAGALDSAAGTGRLADIDHSREICTARRAVIGQAQLLLALRDLPLERPVRDAAVVILKSLAEPYRGHSAFRGEWRLRVPTGMPSDVVAGSR